jgi:hypothetical protein
LPVERYRLRLDGVTGEEHSPAIYGTASEWKHPQQAQSGAGQGRRCQAGKPLAWEAPPAGSQPAGQQHQGRGDRSTSSGCMSPRRTIGSRPSSSHCSASTADQDGKRAAARSLWHGEGWVFAVPERRPAEPEHRLPRVEGPVLERRSASRLTPT